ncbi:hypothetical protein [Reinekea blandensis]|uniref:Uncharacterized protein n=1 Tax=Reinekea blandensis MED297 TaxID=314283 RepID=A4BK62_9GAMM|nr:hypothetical protein [Reinekea blandensis]EAR07491.1 hypothetical protein MED297_09631 [Reinekea sp. MED297] [Reinekea blandensis MED297]
MNLLQSLLCQALSLPLSELDSTLKRRADASDLPISQDELRSILACDPAVTDQVWKLSVMTCLPHQWLFDAFKLQCELSVSAVNVEDKWQFSSVCC